MRGEYNDECSPRLTQPTLLPQQVTLWKLAALNPCIPQSERDTLRDRLVGYHLAVVEKVHQAAHAQNGSGGGVQQQQQRSAGGGSNGSNNNASSRPGRPSDYEIFPGFKPAIEVRSGSKSPAPVAQSVAFMLPKTDC